jgi:hypothetical protein
MAAEHSSAAALKGGHALLKGGKPLFELGCGVTAEDALANHGLLQTIEAFLDLPKRSVGFGAEFSELFAEFTQQAQSVVLGRAHRKFLVRRSET